MIYIEIGRSAETAMSREQRIAFVEKWVSLPPNPFGGTSYWPIFCSHGGGYVEPKELANGDVIYLYEGEILRTERLPIRKNNPGTMEYKFWLTTRFIFKKEGGVVVEQTESHCHIDGTEEGVIETTNDNFGASGFGRWNDNSTGMWDWD